MHCFVFLSIMVIIISSPPKRSCTGKHSHAHAEAEKSEQSLKGNMHAQVVNFHQHYFIQPRSFEHLDYLNFRDKQKVQFKAQISGTISICTWAVEYRAAIH